MRFPAALLVLLLLGLGGRPAAAQGPNARPALDRSQARPERTGFALDGQAEPAFLSALRSQTPPDAAGLQPLLVDAPQTDAFLVDLSLLHEARQFIGRMTTYRSEDFSVSIDPLKPRWTLQIRLQDAGEEGGWRMED